MQQNTLLRAWPTNRPTSVPELHNRENCRCDLVTEMPTGSAAGPGHYMRICSHTPDVVKSHVTRGRWKLWRAATFARSSRSKERRLLVGLRHSRGVAVALDKTPPQKTHLPPDSDGPRDS